jgi:hypothetical protein
MMTNVLSQQKSDPKKRNSGRIAIASPLNRVSVSPKFNRSETVSFVGGVGKIKSFHPNSGTWVYRVEMELGPEPDIGRIGSETTVLLHESDICEVAIAQ